MFKVVTFLNYNSYRAKANNCVRKNCHLSNNANPYCLIQNICSPFSLSPLCLNVSSQLNLFSHG